MGSGLSTLQRLLYCGSVVEIARPEAQDDGPLRRRRERTRQGLSS